MSREVKFSRKEKLPCKTFLVAECLRVSDDYLSVRKIFEQTEVPSKNIQSALWALQKYGAVEAVKDSDGSLHWFWTGNDSRSRQLEERTKEDKPRSRKKSQVKA